MEQAAAECRPPVLPLLAVEAVRDGGTELLHSLLAVALCGPYPVPTPEISVRLAAQRDSSHSITSDSFIGLTACSNFKKSTKPETFLVQNPGLFKY